MAETTLKFDPVLKTMHIIAGDLDQGDFDSLKNNFDETVAKFVKKLDEVGYTKDNDGNLIENGEMDDFNIIIDLRARNLASRNLKSLIDQMAANFESGNWSQNDWIDFPKFSRYVKDLDGKLVLVINKSEGMGLPINDFFLSDAVVYSISDAEEFIKHGVTYDRDGE